MAAAVESSPVLADPSGQRVLSVRHYEAMPPANITKGLIDGDVIATTKEEEWVTKKKVELTTTRQIETRVKRQLVLEDGKVVEDSGPIVSTNTTEDTEKQEHKQTEHRTTGDDPPGEGWLAIPTEGEGLIKEVRERTVHSKEEKQELVETEDVQHLGDLSDEAYLSSVRSNQDVRLAVKSGGQNSTSLQVSEGPRVVHQSSRSRRVVDTDDTQELSRVQNGHVITETRHTTEREEDRGEHVPEDDGAASEEEREINHKEGTQRYAHTKEQDLVEFLGTGGKKIGEQMRYSAENVEGATEGDPDPEWESLSTRMQKMRRHQPGPAAVGSPITNPTAQEAATAAARKDALTKRPLDFDQEEETRKVETSKWLEHHFGSDSRSSKSSIDDEQPAVPSGAHFINVTMKSRPINGTGTKITRATPSPRPTSPPMVKPIPAVFSPARVFLSSLEPNSEPTSLQSPPPPPPPVMPPSVNHTVNGRQNSSSSAGSVNAGFFQGVSEWSERRNSNGLSTTLNGRQDRIQVLPTGPGHTFNPPPVQNNVNNNNSFVSTRVNGFTNQSSSYTQSRVNGTKSPPSMLNRINNTASPTPVETRVNGTTSPIALINTSRMNGTASPPPLTTQHRLNGSVSPNGYPKDQRPISPPQGYRSFEEEEENVTTWRGRAVSPPRQQASRGLRDRRGSADLLEPRGFVEVPRTERRGSADLLRNNRRGSSEMQRTDRRGSSELLKIERRYSSPPPREIEPPPDYSPGHRRRSRVTSSPSPSPPPHESSRKSNQKTRFADPPQQKTKSSFGDSLRRFVGKFRSSDDKNKKRKSSRTTSPSRSYRQGSENNNIPSSANRRLRVGRGESPPNEAVRRGYSAEDVEEEVYSDEEEGGMTSPVPPPRVRQRQPSPGHHHQLDSRLRRDQMMEPRRFYLGEDPFGGSIYGREKEYDGVTPPARSARSGRHHSHRSRRGSQQDEEGSSSHTRNVVWHEEVRGGNNRASPPRAAPTVNTNSSTLGRYSRSAGRLHSQFEEGGAPRSTQTLPRKLHRDEPSSRVVTTTSRGPNNVTRTVSSTSHWESGGRLSRSQPHTGSLINVSFINNVTPSTTATPAGPAKPARTYRSSLARSQSFNVTANEAPPPRRLFQQQQPKSASYYRSNPHIHRLDEASSPLKSPGIISSISRSQRDLNEAIKRETLIEEDENKFSPRLGSKSPSGMLNGGHISSGHLHENKKKLFMKGLLDRAPELYRTLHGDEAGPVSPSAPHATNTPHRVEYSSSFRSSDSSMLTPGVRPARTRRSTTSPPNSLLTPIHLHNGDTKTLLSPSQSFRSHTSGTGSNNDYSETVRFTSTSDDPVRPSVTNTVKNFSKKTVASPRASGGVATETIESTETTTVTKSRVRDPQSAFISSYSSNSLGKNKFLMDQQNAASPTRNGGVVIEVRNNNR